MEKNTILLSAKDYNEIRDIAEAFKREEAVEMYDCYNEWTGSTGHYNVVTKDTALKNAAKATEKLKEAIKKLNEDISKKVEELAKVREMSIWKFLKWRKNK